MLNSEHPAAGSVNQAQLKKKLRSDFQKKIDLISFSDLILKSQNLVNSFQQSFLQTVSASALTGRFIVSFYPFGNEPQINIESEARDEVYQVAYVRIADWANREMVSAQARRDHPGQWEEFEVSSNKVFQPCASQPICKPEDIAAILVPGLGFTRQGERLGRGAGFYDRFLNEYPHALRVGIAFEEQMTENLPVESWDQKVDVILTDRGVHEVISTKLLGEWRTQGKILKR